MSDPAEIVFVPASAAEARAMVQHVSEQVQAFTVTDELRAILDVDGDEEQTERAAMIIASVQGLARYGRRLVLVAHVPPSVMGDNEEHANGGVTLTQLDAKQITAWFSDETLDVTAEAAEAVRGMIIDDAWNDVLVQSLLVEHEMLWHDITEELPDPTTDPWS